MKVMVEGLTLERRDGLIAIEGISEVLVRGNEVLLLPVGAEYEPPEDEPETSDEDEESEVEDDPLAKPKAPAKKPAVKPASKPLSPTADKGGADLQTLAIIRELGGGSASMIAERLKVTEQTANNRLAKLKAADLVAPQGLRPKKWKLTGKGLDVMDGKKAL